MKRWLPYLMGLVGILAGVAIGNALAGNDVGALGDWRNGAGRFIGMCGAIGAGLGYFVTRFLVAGAQLARDGFTLSYKRIEPTADGYRDMASLTVDSVLAQLREVGYAPDALACDALGEPRGAVDPQAPLSGTSFAIRDPRVRGYVRVELARPVEGQPRALGLIEVWSARGESAGELGLFVLRSLDRLVTGLHAARESSRLGEDPASLLVAGLGERPAHRS